MKLNLPEWTKGRGIYVVAGIECVMRNRGEGWERKVSRCSMCGRCCGTTPSGVKTKETEMCQYLVPYGGEGKMICALGSRRPFECCVSDGLDAGIEECSVRWEKV